MQLLQNGKKYTKVVIVVAINFIFNIVIIIKGDCTSPRQFFIDGCYARLLLLYSYRSFFTTTQRQSTVGDKKKVL